MSFDEKMRLFKVNINTLRYEEYSERLKKIPESVKQQFEAMFDLIEAEHNRAEQAVLQSEELSSKNQALKEEI